MAASLSMINEGDQFEFMGLRKQGQDLEEAHAEWKSKKEIKVLTVFSISTSGSVTYRIDDVSDSKTLHDIISLRFYPKAIDEKIYLHSAPLTEVERMVEERIWVDLEYRELGYEN